MQLNREYLRSILFGLEDSLISVTGLIAGLSVGTDDRQVVLLGAIVAIIIEAASMGASEYLSDDAMAELEKLKRHSAQPFMSGLLLFVAYILAGLVPLLPVVFFNYPTSLTVGVIGALLCLGVIGILKARIVGSSIITSVTKIVMVGGLATALGVIVGLVLHL